MNDLEALLAAAGLSGAWRDAEGNDRQVERRSLLAILEALGLPGANDRQIADSLAQIERRDAAVRFVSADAGGKVALPRGLAGAAVLVLEDGSRHAIDAADGVIVAPSTPGYHRLEIADNVVDLAIAPPRCWPLPEGRHWGAAVQIAALRGERSGAFGDFGTLAEAARAAAERGAAALAINPVHALFPADATRFSPYAPSSRLFLNALLGDAASIGIDRAETPSALIDWTTAIPARLAAFQAAYDGLDDAGRAELARFREEGGEALDRHALFDALHAHFFPASGWQDWPGAYHDPDGAAVGQFARDHAALVDFYAFLQWRARDGLAAAQRAAIDGGMAIGLVADLAVGMDPGGSHAWSRRDDLLTGLSIGAPPDPLGPAGQHWGITALAPDALRRTGFAAFKATLRTAMAHAGGLRIDHALGLARLWVMPDRARADEGAYLAMPLDDMLRIVAIESHRARAIVIGEDLGTVPAGFRDIMAARGIAGMAVLPFERDAHGFVPAAGWRKTAVAMTGTHDTPTIAGWWLGRDIGWRAAIAGTPPAGLDERQSDRAALWETIGEGAPPNDPGAVVDAAIGFVAATPCPLVLVPMEDLIGAEEQPNLPGTTTEHPNWRRRLPAATAALLDDPATARRIAVLNETTA